ncbi:MAG: ATP-binding protein [Gaiellaceae bacterium]
MTAAEHGSDRAFARLAWAVLGIGTAGSVVYAFVLSITISNLLYYSVITAALGLGWVGILRRPFSGRWIAVLLVAGISAWLVTDWLWWLGELLNRSVPFPSPIDALYMGAYLPMFGALVWFWRRHMTGVFGGLLESAIIATAFSVFMWVAVIVPAGGQPDSSGLSTSTAIAYPALDTMLLVGLGQLLLVPSLRHARALQAMTLGIAMFLFSDIVYAYDTARGTSVEGTWRDCGWLFAYVLWGFAALHPSLRLLGTSQPRPIRRWVFRTSLLALACLSMPVALLIAVRREALDATLFLALGSFTIVAVFLRMGLILRVQQRHEDELAETLEKLETLIDTAPLAIVAVESKRLVTLWNPGAERLFGWRADEVIGKRYPLGASEEVTHNFDRLFSGETFHGESTRLRKDGSTIEVIISSAPLRNQTGEAIGAVGLFLDTSELKALEGKLLHSQRLETVGQLAGGVAHDFNNLLTAISGYCNLSLERANGDPELAHDLREIARASERATELTRQLLAFGRRQVLRPTTFDLNQAVFEMNAILGRLLGEQIRIVHALEPSGCSVNTDQGQIEQVLMNLAVNARDAMPEGGTLSFVTENVNLTASQAEPLALQAGRYAHLRVTDTGQGMDKETRERVFEPFFTTKEVGKGSGLGLATVFGIVNQSGGQISVESELGAGTSFDIYLPWSELEPSSAANEQDRRISGGCERILLVEDEPGVREITARMLARKGYEVIVAAEPKEALDLASRVDFDLLLTDMVLPDMDGRRLAAELCSRKPDLRVVYVSGYPRDGLEEGDLDQGTRFLQKPYSADDLARTVRGTLDSAPLAVISR